MQAGLQTPTGEDDFFWAPAIAVSTQAELQTPTGEDDPFWASSGRSVVPTQTKPKTPVAERSPLWAERIEVPQDQLFACPALQLELRGLLGEGAYGKVFQACEMADCRKVVKVQVLADQLAQQNFAKEVEFSRIASDNDFGPRLFSACITDGERLVDLFRGQGRFSLLPMRNQPSVGIMVSEMWDGALDKLLKDDGWCDQALYRAFEERVARMHALDIVHADLLPKNVLYKYDESGNVAELIPTDFGLSFYASEFAELPEDWRLKLAIYNLKNPDQPTWPAIEQTPKLLDATWQEVQEDPFLLDEPLLVLLQLLC